MTLKEPIRIALWSGPRDVATALLYAFAQREDTNVTDEPLFGYYLGFSGIDVPFREEALKKMEIDPHKILDMLVNCDLNKDILFVKSKSDQVVGLNWDFMPRFKNIFLISSPNRMIVTNDYEREEQGLIDTCYEVQYQQLLYLIQLGIEPIVIDVQELLESPAEILPRLCRKLGIDFDKNMLKWPKGIKEEESLASRHWCGVLHESESFDDISNELKILTPQQEELAEECQPFYDRLRKYALTID